MQCIPSHLFPLSTLFFSPSLVFVFVPTPRSPCLSTVNSQRPVCHSDESPPLLAPRFPSSTFALEPPWLSRSLSVTSTFPSLLHLYFFVHHHLTFISTFPSTITSPSSLSLPKASHFYHHRRRLDLASCLVAANLTTSDESTIFRTLFPYCIATPYYPPTYPFKILLLHTTTNPHCPYSS